MQLPRLFFVDIFCSILFIFSLISNILDCLLSIISSKLLILSVNILAFSSFASQKVNIELSILTLSSLLPFILRFKDFNFLIFWSSNSENSFKSFANHHVLV